MGGVGAVVPPAAAASMKEESEVLRPEVAARKASVQLEATACPRWHAAPMVL